MGDKAIWGSSMRAAGPTLVLVASLMAASPTSVELPPEIQADRLLVQAERETRDGNHWSAARVLEQVLEVYEAHNLNVPTEIWFRQARAYQNAGLHERAVEAATRYLHEAGREGEHYQGALQVLDAAEVDLAEARREEVRRRAAAEREERRRQELMDQEARSYADFRRVLLADGEGRISVLSDGLRSGGEGPVMVVVPGGAFDMGCDRRRDIDRKVVSRKRRTCGEWGLDDALPLHRVQIASFAISRMPVTHAEWNLCVRHGGCERTGYSVEGADAVYLIRRWWDQTQEYVSWLSRESGQSYRLPTEAEWEYAIRAGGRAGYVGLRYYPAIRPKVSVGSLASNAFGLYRVVGEGDEWVEDCWNPNYVGAPDDGSAWTRGDCSLRVIRFNSGSALRGIAVPAVMRYRADAFNRRDGTIDLNGFRVVRSPTR